MKRLKTLCFGLLVLAILSCHENTQRVPHQTTGSILIQHVPFTKTNLLSQKIRDFLKRELGVIAHDSFLTSHTDFSRRLLESKHLVILNQSYNIFTAEYEMNKKFTLGLTNKKDVTKDLLRDYVQVPALTRESRRLYLYVRNDLNSTPDKPQFAYRITSSGYPLDLPLMIFFDEKDLQHSKFGNLSSLLNGQKFSASYKTDLDSPFTQDFLLTDLNFDAESKFKNRYRLISVSRPHNESSWFVDKNLFASLKEQGVLKKFETLLLSGVSSLNNQNLGKSLLLENDSNKNTSF